MAISEANQSNDSQFPSIVLFVHGNNKFEDQEYPDFKVVNLDSSVPIAKAFNDAEEQQQDCDYFGYMGFNHTFASPHSLNIITAKLQSNEHIAGLYADGVNISNRVNHFYPAYDPDVLSCNTYVNPPLFCKRALKFNEKLQYLVFMDVLLQARNHTIWYHYAQPLIGFIPENLSLTEDHKLLKELHDSASV